VISPSVLSERKICTANHNISLAPRPRAGDRAPPARAPGSRHCSSTTSIRSFRTVALLQHHRPAPRSCSQRSTPQTAPMPPRSRPPATPRHHAVYTYLHPRVRRWAVARQVHSYILGTSRRESLNLRMEFLGEMDLFLTLPVIQRMRV
jgi:hypothetical protein